MRTPALLTVVILLGSLAACSTTGDDSTTGDETNPASDCPPTLSGAVSDAVKVSGDFGSKPTVAIAFPTTASITQRTVVIEGTGDVARQQDVVYVDFSLYNGATGDELSSTDYGLGSTRPIPIDDTQVLPGFVKTLECTRVGSRVVGVIPPDDSFGDAGSSEAGVKPGQDIVFVVDVESIARPGEAPLTEPDGVDQAPTDGFPAVFGSPDSYVVTIPDAAPPTELKVALLKKGDHATVKAGDNVIVNYVEMNWNTNEQVDTSFAYSWTTTFITSRLIPGLNTALVGQKVGSRVLVIIPPDQGYGAAGSPPHIGGTDTLFFVVDILGIG